jgi:hypothetical protein
LGYNFLISALVIEWSTIMQGFFEMQNNKIHIGLQRYIIFSRKLNITRDLVYFIFHLIVLCLSHMLSVGEGVLGYLTLGEREGLLSTYIRCTLTSNKHYT